MSGRPWRGARMPTDNLARLAPQAHPARTWRFNDGGRKAAGFKGEVGDCVTRAIAIVTGQPYRRTYDELHARSKAYAIAHRGKIAADPSPRNGVFKEVARPYLKDL